MVFIQMHQNVINHDAIGNDIEIISNILNEEYECLVYADFQINKNVKYVNDEQFDDLANNPENVIIYHHSVYWEKGFDKLKSAKCRIVFRYHNITPEEFFKPYNDISYLLCKKGREQTLEMGKEFPDSYWFCDSTFNSFDLTNVEAKRKIVCPPFNKMEEWGKKSPDEGILKELKESNNINILFVGRVVPNKGHLMLLDIIRCYKDYYGYNIKLRVIGKFFDDVEDYNDIVKQRIEEYDLSDNIEFIGEVNDNTLMAYYMGSDVMLVCSDHEGFCVPVIEAQYFGLPIVALSKGAVSETIGLNQILLDENIKIYAAAIKKITENKECSDYLAQKGRENYDNRFSHETVKELFLKSLKKMTKAD